MKADAHYDKAERLADAQARLDPTQDWELIVEGCYMSAHNFVLAGSEWVGVSHSQSHMHKENVRLLKQAAAPAAVQDAWTSWRFYERATSTAREPMAAPAPRREGIYRSFNNGRRLYGPKGRYAMRKRDTIFSLYDREYPRLLLTLSRLAKYVQSGSAPPVTLLALFGSTAQLTAGSSSDADLLALFDDAATAETLDSYVIALIRQIRAIEEETGKDVPCWPITLIPGSATASELDADLLENIGREGVLVYHREGSPYPTALGQLEPFDQWSQRVHDLLAMLPHPAPSL
jgi:predicted nucleotidyltransferase